MLNSISGLISEMNGYGSTVVGASDEIPDTTVDWYAAEQSVGNVQKTLNYILPYVMRQRADTVLDIGCGVGAMVTTLLKQGYDAFGVDLPGLERYWSSRNLPHDRFFIVGSPNTHLPFCDESIDFAFTLGVIEHVGTTDGHADRRPDFHEIRRAWVLEAMRVLKVGGHLLIGGPNRGFPIDVARVRIHEHPASRKYCPV